MSNSAFPTVYIQRDALTKFKTYIRYATGEISGLGTVTLDQGELIVEDLFLLEQECSATETELSDEQLHRFLAESMARGIDPERLKLWWHSHVNMGVFWSGTDNDTIKKFKSAGWWLSIVGNKKGEFKARVDLWEPFQVAMDDCPFMELREMDWDLDRRLKEEVAEKVKVKSYTVSRPALGSYGQLYLPRDTRTPEELDAQIEAWKKQNQAEAQAEADWAEQWRQD